MPASRQSYIRSLMRANPEAAAREIESILGRMVSVGKKPRVFLDENVAYLNYPRDDLFPLKVVKRLKEKGVEASFVGDKREFEGLEKRMWVRSPLEQEVFRIMDDCHRVVGTGAYRGERLDTASKQNKAFKSCITETTARAPGSRIQGFHQVPPRESSDYEIGKWADENGILVISFDADAGLEGKERGDRIRMEQTQAECDASGIPRAGRRPCGSQDEEADRLANLIITRLNRVRDLLKESY